MLCAAATREQILSSKGPYFDSHCHLQLDPLWENRVDIIKRLKEKGVSGVGLASTTPGECFARVEQLVLENPGFVFPSFGLHPCWIAQYIKQSRFGGEDGLLINDVAHVANVLNTLQVEIAAMLVKYQFAGVGECGLDKRISTTKRGSVDSVSMDLQRKIFEIHIDLGISFGRYVVCHCVGCWGALYSALHDKYAQLDGLEKILWPPIILHSCNGMSVDMAKLFIENIENVYFSFSAGNISPKVCELIRCLPVDKILMESDSPDQPLNKKSLESISQLLIHRRGGVEKILELCDDSDKIIHDLAGGANNEHVEGCCGSFNTTGTGGEECKNERAKAGLIAGAQKVVNDSSVLLPLCEILSQFIGFTSDDFLDRTTRNAEHVFQTLSSEDAIA